MLSVISSHQGAWCGGQEGHSSNIDSFLKISETNLQLYLSLRAGYTWFIKTTQAAVSVNRPISSALSQPSLSQTLGKLLGVWRHVPAKSTIVFFTAFVLICTLFLGFVCYLPWGDRTYNWFIEGLNFSYLNIAYINSRVLQGPQSSHMCDLGHSQNWPGKKCLRIIGF